MMYFSPPRPSKRVLDTRDDSKGCAATFSDARSSGDHRDRGSRRGCGANFMGDLHAQSGAKRRAHEGKGRLEGKTVGFPLKWRSFRPFLSPWTEKDTKTTLGQSVRYADGLQPKQETKNISEALLPRISTRGEKYIKKHKQERKLSQSILQRLAPQGRMLVDTSKSQRHAVQRLARNRHAKPRFPCQDGRKSRKQRAAAA